VVTDAGDFDGFAKGNAELFAEFAGKGLLKGFASTHFAAGEFPFEGGSVASAALADKDAAIRTFNDSGDDVEHERKVCGY
jgi:hypothetical protein